MTTSLNTRQFKLIHSTQRRMSDRSESERVRLDKANFSPIQEERTIEKFRIEGKIPQELNGLYIRNGANAKQLSSHFFLGEGMLHGIWLNQGHPIRYCNRYVKTGTRNLAAGLSNVSVLAFAERLFSLGEIGPAFHIDPKKLTTIDKYLFAGQRTKNFTAHPKKDANGELFCFGYDLIQQPYLTYMHFNKKAKLLRSEPIQLNAAKMIHDFAITQHRVVFMDLPIVFDVTLAASTMLDHFLGLTSSMPFRWKPALGARLGVMPKAGSNADIQWFNIKPCFIFHTVNAFEEGEKIFF